MVMFSNFTRLARLAVRQGGSVSFEWPRFCSGWAQRRVIRFIMELDLQEALCDGCAFGLRFEENLVYKPWRFVTNNKHLAWNLNQHRCTKDHVHERVEGNITAKTAYYNKNMCECMMHSIFREQLHEWVPSMVCVPVRDDQEQREKECDPTAGVDIPSGKPYGTVFEGEGLFNKPTCSGLVTRLLDRKEMLSSEAAMNAVRSEFAGLEKKDTWDKTTVKEHSDLVSDAKARNVQVHIGKLMAICSEKFSEREAQYRVLKGRIVFRGDICKDALGAAAVFQDLSASPTSIHSLNLNLCYGAIKGHSTTCADAVDAYVQSELKSKAQTWIEIPRELWPKEWHSQYKRPVVLLRKSLYGHPESGAHWEKHLETVLTTKLQGQVVPEHPWSYWFEQDKLLLTVYVDDFTLSGPQDKHQAFWEKLSQHVD